MVCPGCRHLKAEKRALFTHLNRVLALRLTCEKLGELIRADNNLVKQIIGVCRREVEALQQPDPDQIGPLTSQDEQLSRRIRFVLTHFGETEEDEREAAAVLTELRRERAEIRAAIGSLEAASNGKVEIPAEEQVVAMLDDFRRILTAAARGELGDDAGIEVTIDFRHPVSYDAESELAKELYDKGLLGTQVAQELECNPAKVVKLLDHAFAKHGEKRPDGRERRAMLKQKQMTTPKYKQLADAAKRLWDEGLAAIEIGRRHHCSDLTAWKAIAHWHRSRGLPVPTAKTRREQVMNRAKEQLYDGGVEVEEIAAALGYTSRGMTLLLQRWFQNHGQTMPDGRSRRGGQGNAQVGVDRRHEDFRWDHACRCH